MIAVVSLVAIGCGDPPQHPITGNITLDGRPYERLIVYMGPMKGDVTPFNKGVGESDVTGKLIMNSSASTALSLGLAVGEYRVYFNIVSSSLRLN